MSVEQYSLVANDWLNLESIINDLTQRVVGQEIHPTSSPTFAGLTLTGIADTHVVYSKAGVLTGDSALVWDDGAAKALTIGNCAVLGSDSVLFQPNANSTTFVQVKDADGGTPVLCVDTTTSAVGINSIPDGFSDLMLVRSKGDFDGDTEYYFARFYPSWNPTDDLNYKIYGCITELNLRGDLTPSGALTGDYVGGRFRVLNRIHTQTVADIFGGEFVAWNLGDGGNYGTVTRAIGGKFDILKSGGTITNAYGVYIEDIDQGTNNWSIYSIGGTAYFGGEIQGASGAKIGDGGITNYLNVDGDGDLSFAGTARIDWTKITANGVTLGDGPPTSGDTVSDLQTANDGNTYTVDEIAANAGQNLIVDFTGVTAFNWVQILGRYAGQGGHSLTIQLEITPFDDSAWHTFHTMIDQPANQNMQNFSFFVPDDSAYINSGVVKVRFIHEMAGNANDDWVFDVVALYQ